MSTFTSGPLAASSTRWASGAPAFWGHGHYPCSAAMSEPPPDSPSLWLPTSVDPPLALGSPSNVVLPATCHLTPSPHASAPWSSGGAGSAPPGELGGPDWHSDWTAIRAHLGFSAWCFHWLAKVKAGLFPAAGRVTLCTGPQSRAWKDPRSGGHGSSSEDPHPGSLPSCPEHLLGGHSPAHLLGLWPLGVGRPGGFPTLRR